MIFLLKYLFDTNACINYLNLPNSKIWQKITATPNFETAVCSIVKAELLLWIAEKQKPNSKLGKTNGISQSI